MSTDQQKLSDAKGWVETFTQYLPSFGQSDGEERQSASGGTPQLTAAEVQAHPEYPHAYWKLSPDRHGRVDVAAGRGGPFKIAYEMHGHGSTKIVVSFFAPFRQKLP